MRFIIILLSIGAGLKSSVLFCRSGLIHNIIHRSFLWLGQAVEKRISPLPAQLGPVEKHIFLSVGPARLKNHHSFAGPTRWKNHLTFASLARPGPGTLLKKCFTGCGRKLLMMYFHLRYEIFN